MLYDLILTLLYLVICAACAMIGWIGGSISPIKGLYEYFWKGEDDEG